MAIEIPARVDFLKKIHLFYGLEDDDYERIASELDEMQVAQGGVVFEQGAKADSFYLIYGGSVRIIRKHNNKEFQLAILVKNDYFGEMALVEHRPRSGTVTALTDTSLLEFGIKSRQIESFRKAALEASMSRVYGGIHYRFDVEKGNELGQMIGKQVVQRLKLRKTNTAQH